ncbi:hypothetical protein GCM10011386_00400 [Parapedobacter defluvii]|uniref:DoxX family protein n=1 Tax=Parapedobacter defluvii TaxID=2045106 RepID=A0ABQ1L1Y9_9SPHI|nr:hypothetical protein [Parapedobacter defluvii]RQP14264.1 MAG: hypothetical protein EAS52_17790 [Parapedobacter sp.]GGC12667.1 hypothetical protein GCM10011386_00400 [Parapedobacter defluvii]
MSLELTGNSPQAAHQADAENKEETARNRPWTTVQKTAFRIGFVYFVLLCIPAYGNFYRDLFKLFDFSKLTYHDFQAVVAFWPPQFILIESEEGVFGIFNYINLILLLVLAIVVGVIWTFLDKKSINYSKLYYWARVLVRYRLAYGMVGWGLKKAFPMQMVYPTIGMLNTPFVDMAEKKLYWSHVGVSFGYTVFLGFAEIIPGLLLLHRKTASLGGALAAVVCLNICIANHAYDAGVAVPAAYFTLLGIFVAWYDLPKIWDLLVNQKNVAPYRYYPVLSGPQQTTRTVLKVFFNTIFVPVAAAFWAYGFFNGNNYNIPSTAGLKDIQGLYQVSEFRLNGEELPYSPADSIRWHDAIFERWSTLSYSTNRGALVDRMIGYSPLRVKGDTGQSKYNQVNTQDSDELFKKSRNRDLGVTRWEVGGMAGNRRYFFYELDSANQLLKLQNKNKNHQDETQSLRISRPTDDRVILSGLNEFRDSIYVVLDRIHKKYPLVEGRDSPVTEF